MTVRLLLRLTSVAEGPVGVAFLLAPDLPTRILFGQALDGTLPELIARIGGTAIIALSLACWRAGEDSEGRAAAGLLLSLLFYNAIVAALFAYSRFALHLSGIGFWPALAAHLLLAAWCVKGLLTRSGAAVRGASFPDSPVRFRR